MLQALLGRFADIAEVLMKAHIAITPFFFFSHMSLIYAPT